MTEKGLSLAVMEYSTGGSLTATVSDAADVSIYFKGGLVACSRETLVAYGVDAELISYYGAISSEVAQAMAEAARLRLGANIGVSITGVIGPDELEGKPVGTIYIGMDNSQNKTSVKGDYPTRDRSRIKSLVTVAALFGLRKMLLALD
jgi:nicotinamide-nucleotide amidase